MLRGFELRYLGRVAAGETTSEARTSVPASVRFFALRGARRHVVKVSMEVERADDEAHVHRLAYLHALGERVVNPNELAVVRELFEARRALGREQGAWRRAAAGLGVVGAVLVAVAFAPAMLRMAQPETELGAALGADGGSPESSLEAEAEEPAHALDAFFRHDLPRYTIALDARGAGREPAVPNDVASQRAHALSVLEELSPSLVEPMVGLLDSAEHYVSPDDRGSGAEQVEDERWTHRLIALHDALAEAGVPFYLDAQLLRSRRSGRQRILLSTYDVQRRRVFEVDGRQITSLDITRLDSLNHVRSLLGYTRPEIRYALVVGDRIERFLVSQALPSADSVAESVVVRGYEDETGIEWVTEFETWAQADLLAEGQSVIAASGAEVATLGQLAAAVVRRRRAVAALSQSLRRRGVELNEPRAYAYDPSELEHLAASSPGALLAEVRAAQHELESAPVRGAYLLFEEAVRLSVSEHEVQHRVDYEAGRMAEVPEALEVYVGRTESEDRVNRLAESTNAELSAYLSQIAQRPSMARTSMIRIATFAMDRHSWGTAESLAALVLFEAMAEQAGVGHGDLTAQRRVQRSEIAKIYGELREREAPAISAIARAAWESLYGAELLPIVAADASD